MGVRFAIRWLLPLAALLVVAAGPAAAQGDAAAGRFILVTGDVRVLARDGSARAAQRDGEFRQGESIVTGASGLAQLRMSDGGAVSVRPDSQMKLDAYSYAGSDDRNASFFVSVLKGGFRTITGLIARNNRNSYRISTASATIGVRGTHFEVVHVPQALAGTAAGTYNRVYDGITTFQNRAGAVILVNRDQTAFVALPSNLPPVLVRPPAGIFDKPTPVPVLGPQSRREGDGPTEGGRPAPRVTQDAPAVKEATPATPATMVAPNRVLTAPLLNPIDSPRVLDVSPTFQTTPATTLQTTPGLLQVTPATTLQSAPRTTIDPSPTTTLSPILSAPAATISPVLTAPATISPILTSPATTTISPVMTAPATMTISPVLTAPAATMISPVLTAPVTTTISPVLTAPATIQSPATSTIIRR